MFVDDFAKQLSRDLDLDPPLVSDEEGRYQLIVADSLRIEIQPHEAGLVITAAVGPCPEQEQEAFLRMLLLANLLGQGTGRSMLALDKEGKEVQLVLALPYEVPYLKSRDLLEEFLNYAQYWIDEIKERT